MFLNYGLLVLFAGVAVQNASLPCCRWVPGTDAGPLPPVVTAAGGLRATPLSQKVLPYAGVCLLMHKKPPTLMRKAPHRSYISAHLVHLQCDYGKLHVWSQ